MVYALCKHTYMVVGVVGVDSVYNEYTRSRAHMRGFHAYSKPFHT